jgi:hypothetical protein
MVFFGIIGSKDALVQYQKNKMIIIKLNEFLNVVFEKNEIKSRNFYKRREWKYFSKFTR